MIKTDPTMLVCNATPGEKVDSYIQSFGWHKEQGGK